MVSLERYPSPRFCKVATVRAFDYMPNFRHRSPLGAVLNVGSVRLDRCQRLGRLPPSAVAPPGGRCSANQACVKRARALLQREESDVCFVVIKSNMNFSLLLSI